jgi:tetratricopeptide (TPR) repeat protein
MKNIKFLFLLITQVFFAQNGFEAGNALYKSGNYKEAISEYENVLVTKKQSPELYFNIANCYYKLGKVAPAIYNYEKALVLNPNGEEIKNNLEIAKKLQIDDIKVIPKVGFAKLLQNGLSAFHYNTWAWIAVGLATLFLLFFIGYYFSEMTLLKRIFFLGMFVSLLFILISVSAAIFERNHFKNDKPAIIFAEIVSLKSKPIQSSKDVMVLHEGTKVFVQENKHDNYEKVQLTDGTEGWIDKTAIKEVK